MSDEQVITPETQVSHTDDSGRTLSGMGADVERLAETMERHAPPEKTPSGTAGTPASPTPAAADGTPAAPAPPQQTRGRQRFSDLTRERDTAREETAKERTAREAAERRAAELEARLQPAQQPVPQAPPQQQQQQQYTRPMPTVQDVEAGRYETYEAFIRDLQRWEIEQYHAQVSPGYVQTVQQVIAAERAEQQFRSSVQQTHDRGRKAYQDFDTLLKGPAGQVPLGRDPQESMARAQFVIAHPQSEHVQYAILKDVALAQRLQQADPYTFGQMIAGLVPQAQPRPAWTPPPAPYDAVGAAAATAHTTSSDVATKGGKFDEYRQKRAQERGVKSRY